MWLLLQAVDELEVAMRLVDQDLLREAIRGGTAALFQAGTAPETASTVAQVSQLPVAEIRLSLL